MALRDMKKGEPVIKYGFPIGHAKEDIKAGEHVHCHNLQSSLEKLDSYVYEPNLKELGPVPARTFMGYKRADGKVGIRNEVWIIPTVGCVNAIAKSIEKASLEYKTDHIDGIYSYSHPFGCS